MGGTGEEASLGESGSSGSEWSGWRIKSSGVDQKHEQVVFFKSVKGQSLEYNIAAALGLELHNPIMSKLWGLGYQTYRQTFSFDKLHILCNRFPIAALHIN